ncbi:MAG: hypothetical protein Q7U13_15055 [Rhodoferax sp.]|nr:hypothetical protein [Rhodoferax sp.]
MKFVLKTAAFLVTGLLSGCASSLYEGRLSWEDGWREGKITEVGQGATMAETLAENCRFVPLIRSEGVQYVTIQYRNNSRPVWRTVPTPADSHWKVNDLVYVNPKDCSSPVERRAG